jgi:ElaB/YqjD/DUF883 family membrane-anchored ribosome-binding protein
MTTHLRPDLDGHQPSLPTASLSGAFDGLTDTAESLAHRAAEKARAQAHRLLDAGTLHIRERPLQSILVAAATGAVVALLVELVARSVARPR